MRSARGSYRYAETGLSNVILVDVETRTCPRCGERELVTPHAELLHVAVARALSRQLLPLTPRAIRFSRIWLGLTHLRFARAVGVRRETVFRWEQGTACPLPSADRMLKMLVARHEGAEPPQVKPIEQLVSAPSIILMSPDWRPGDHPV